VCDGDGNTVNDRDHVNLTLGCVAYGMQDSGNTVKSEAEVS
jgi:hypothetical protein